MLYSDKNSKIHVKKKDKPSNFVLDLASRAKEQEEILLAQEKNTSILNKGQDKLKKIFKKKKKDDFLDYNDDTDANLFYENYDNQKFKAEDIYEEDTSSPQRDGAYVVVDQLAFFQAIKTIASLVKQLFIFLKRLCFKLGWSFVFALRFVYFLMLSIIKSIGWFFVLIFPKFRGNSKKGIYEEHYENVAPLLPQDIMDPVLLAEDDNNVPSNGATEETNYSPTINNDLIFQNDIAPERSVQKSYSAQNEDYSYPRNDYLSKDILPKKSIFSFIFRPNVSHFRTAIYFAVFMFVLILPFKAFTYYSILQNLGGRVLGVSEDAIGDFKNAGAAAGDLDFYKAGEQFAEASDGFLQAQEEINGISSQLRILSSVIPSDKLALAADARYMLEAGRLSAKIGQQISFIFDTFGYEKDKSIKTIFNTFFENIGPLQENTNRLYEVLLKIDAKNLPVDKRASFETLREKIGQIKNSFVELSDLLDKMKIFLGFNGEKRYLLIFQNNAEMRASGGFMGSFAIVDFNNGEITNIETPKGGTYDTEGGFLDNIVSPEPLHIVNPAWHFWDANWWPDWKKTSRKLEWFYENSGGSSVDGVIGMTPVVVERLLNIIGPLDMQASLGVTITTDNFWEVTQTFAEQKPIDHPAYEPLPFTPTDNQVATGTVTEGVETKKDPGTEPKKIIGDLIDKIKDELPKRLNKDIFLKLVTSLEQSISEKHLLFYSDDYILQDKFEELGWAGRVKKTAWDYLMVVNSNISGAKSDRKIKQEINHQSEVLSDGSIVDTLRITRTHTGVKGDRFTGVKNLDWMRIYLPLGSQFIDAKGFWPPDESLFEKPDPSWRHDPDLKNSEENFVRDNKSWTKIYNEDDKTVFANWVQVDPGESVEVVVRYILPFKLSIDKNESRPFALLVEKQPGAMPSKISSRLILPEDLQIDWHYPDTLKTQTDGWFVEDQLSRDKFWAVLVK